MTGLSKREEHAMRCICKLYSGFEGKALRVFSRVVMDMIYTKESVWLLDGGWIGARIGKGRQESGRKLSLTTCRTWDRVGAVEVGRVNRGVGWET